MGINVIDNKIAAEQISRATAPMLAETLKEVTVKKDEEKKTEEKSSIRQAVDTKSSAKRSTAVLAGLIAKLGSSFKLDLNAKVDSKESSKKDEFDLMLEENRENTGDQVDLQFNRTVQGSKKLSQQNQQFGGGQEAETAGKEIKGDLKDYSTLYAQMLVNNGGEVKKKIKAMEEKLIQQGMSHNDLLSLQSALKNQLRSQIAAQLKEALIKHYFSPEKSIENIMTKSGIHSVFNFAFFNKELGGWDFGGYNDHLQGTLDAKTAEAFGEIRDFTQDELESKITASRLGNKSANFDKEFKEIVKLASKVGFDVKEFLKNWEVKSFDLGLNPVPDNILASSGLGTNADSNRQGSQQNQELVFNQNDEKDLLINQMRACYMQNALHDDPRTKIGTIFKMIKLKNDVVRLGIQFIDFEQIEREGKEIAIDKLRQMLEEALHERATLYDLAGPAYTLVNRKIKGVTKNLERLGAAVSSPELKKLIDQANQKMFAVARQEFEETKYIYYSHPNKTAEKKLGMLSKLLKRIIEESKINTNADFSYMKKEQA